MERKMKMQPDMCVPCGEGFEPVSYTVTEGKVSENLIWVAPNTKKKIYPDFFCEEVLNPSKFVRFFLSDER